MKLFEINEQVDELLETIYTQAEENDGEYDEELEERLGELQVEREDKIEGVILYYKSLIASAKAIKEEEKVLAERRKRAESRAESIKNWLGFILEGNKFQTSKVAISYRKSEQIIVEDFESIPEEYQKVKTIIDADKIAIKKAIKSGIEVAGAELVTKQNLQIK
jgi:hypothetical protein